MCFGWASGQTVLGLILKRMSLEKSRVISWGKWGRNQKFSNLNFTFAISMGHVSGERWKFALVITSLNSEKMNNQKY